jgi:O-methyltransferase
MRSNYDIFYLNFCKRILTDTIYDEELRNNFFQHTFDLPLDKIENALDDDIDFHSNIGDFFPYRADTMIGMKRLDNLQFCVEDVLKNNIEGDFIETGVWRGGASIFMKILLDFYNNTKKVVFVADSFEGLPAPDIVKYPQDEGSVYHLEKILKVSIDEVKNNFQKYHVLDNNVKFLKGWFSTTMKDPSIGKLSILRLDGDLYSSTWDVLSNLYKKVSDGGFIIVDDYYLPTCRLAINDFRKIHNITDPIIPIDWTGVFWKKNSSHFHNLPYPSAGEAFDVLFKIYLIRKDLQDAYPEVSSGDYQALINWAAGVVKKKWKDEDHDILILFKDLYLRYEII